MLTEIQLFESPGLTLLYFCLCDWVKSEIYKRNVDRRDELLGRISNAAVCIKEREGETRRTTRDIRTRVAKCIQVDCGIFEMCIVNCNKFVISVHQICQTLNKSYNKINSESFLFIY